jgi:hypothetical protein
MKCVILNDEMRISKKLVDSERLRCSDALTGNEELWFLNRYLRLSWWSNCLQTPPLHHSTLLLCLLLVPATQAIANPIAAYSNVRGSHLNVQKRHIGSCVRSVEI